MYATFSSKPARAPGRALRFPEKECEDNVTAFLMTTSEKFQSPACVYSNLDILVIGFIVQMYFSAMNKSFTSPEMVKFAMNRTKEKMLCRK